MEDGLGWPLVHFFLQSWGSDHLASVCLGGQGGRAQMRGSFSLLPQFRMPTLSRRIYPLCEMKTLGMEQDALVN